MKSIKNTLILLPIFAASVAAATDYVYIQTGGSGGHTAWNNEACYYLASDVLTDGKIDIEKVKNAKPAGISKPAADDNVFFGTYTGSLNTTSPEVTNANGDTVWQMYNTFHNNTQPILTENLTFDFDYDQLFRGQTAHKDYVIYTNTAETTKLTDKTRNAIKTGGTLSVLGGTLVNINGMKNRYSSENVLENYANYSLIDINKLYLETTDTASSSAKAGLSLGNYIEEIRIGVNEVDGAYSASGIVSELKKNTKLVVGSDKYESHTGNYVGDVNNAGDFVIYGGNFYGVGTINNAADSENIGQVRIGSNGSVKSLNVAGGTLQYGGAEVDGKITLDNVAFKTSSTNTKLNFTANSSIDATTNQFWVNFAPTAGGNPAYDGVKTADVNMLGVYNLKGTGEYGDLYNNGRSIQQVLIAGNNIAINEINFLGNFNMTKATIDYGNMISANNSLNINKLSITSDSYTVGTQYLLVRSANEMNIGSLDFIGAKSAAEATSNVNYIRIFNWFNGVTAKIGNINVTGYSNNADLIGFHSTSSLEIGNLNIERTFRIDHEQNPNISSYQGTEATIGNIQSSLISNSGYSNWYLRSLTVTGDAAFSNATGKEHYTMIRLFKNADFQGTLTVGGESDTATTFVLFENKTYVKDSKTGEVIDERQTHTFNNVVVNQKGIVYFSGNRADDNGFDTTVNSLTSKGNVRFGCGTNVDTIAKIGTLNGIGGTLGAYGEVGRGLTLVLGTDTAGTSIYYGTVFDNTHENDVVSIVKNGANRQILAGADNNIKGTITVNEGVLGFASKSKVASVNLNGGEFASWNSSSAGDLSIGTLNMNGGKLHFDFNTGLNSALSLAKGGDIIGNILSSDFTFANIVTDTSYILFSFEDGSMNSYLQAIVDSADNGKYEYIDKASGKYYFAKFAAEDGAGEFSVMFSVPEPSTWAAIFGALALAFAIYRRRK